MKLILLWILVLKGFTPGVPFLQPVPPTYFLITQAMTWTNARSRCMATYTDLAPIKTYEDLLRIRADDASSQYAIWVGLYNDVNSWRFCYNEVPLSAITFRKWDPIEPNNYKAIESCGIINNAGNWGDYPCPLLLPFICYNIRYPGDGRFVGISSPKLNWTDAQTYCRRFHTDLASALDTTDQVLLQQVASRQGASWFGLYRDTWTWTDHTKALNVSWAAGKPDNYYGNENCGRFFGGLLDDITCTNTHYFYCHYIPPIKRKMLKLKVRSDLNILDADVQSSLLMKIVKKLEDHGMLKDITVMWRVHPDGNIFYQKK